MENFHDCYVHDVQENTDFLWNWYPCIFSDLILIILCFIELVLEEQPNNSCHDSEAIIGGVDDAFGMYCYDDIYMFKNYVKKIFLIHACR